MKRNFTFLFLLVFLLNRAVYGQILSISPVFPHDNDTITIIYHADQGNGALTGIAPVYAHTGVITNLSTSPTDWRYVKGNWGTADPTVLMQQIGVDSHRIKYHVRNFYGVPGGESIEQLAFVFRNATGSIVGRAGDGSDIYTPIYIAGSGLYTTFVKPYQDNFIAAVGDTIKVDAWASDSVTLSLTDNGVPVASGTGENLLHNLVVATPGNHTIVFTATDGVLTSADTFVYVVNPVMAPQNPPAGYDYGISYVNDSTVLLKLFSPGKSFSYVIGDFNNWQLNTNFYMNRSLDNNTFWIEITGLTPGVNYGFQYFVDGEIRVGDPYSTLVLDPDNDRFITSFTYPNMPQYPTGKTTGIVSVLQTGQTPYPWINTSFTAPAAEDLVVYELLVRDFMAAHDYKTLKDTLDYLENLGVNAIGLMPINEFEGNESWGYNPSFHMATDKYYGPPETLKALIDECHSRGIAVILDVVFNHAFSQSPLCRLYWDDVNFRPAPDNPWLNPIEKHPFNVGYDFNHESQATKDFMDHCLTYFVDEFKIDGFRFDLSKGFTQTNSGSDVGLWSQYDASRIALLKRMYDTLRGLSPDVYVILEHFADNNEERELANYGMMLWGNLNYNYNEATMGYASNSNFNWISWQQRGWSQSNVMGYMESHDEERLMYKNLQFGNGLGNYDITDLSTALDRMELAGTFFFTIPGPKMMWQFGEVGYDVSIDDPCRVCNKPIRWNYYQDSDRLHLYKVWKALIHLKTTYSTFSTNTYSLNVGGITKTINLDDPNMNATIVGNFGVSAQNANPTFQHTGWWYEYFTGDSISISSTSVTLNLAAGEYRLYTDVRLPLPDLDVVISTDPAQAQNLPLEVFPNPTEQVAYVRYSLPNAGEVSIQVVNLLGAIVQEDFRGVEAAGEHHVQLANLESGVYLVRVQAGSYAGVKRLIVR